MSDWKTRAARVERLATLEGAAREQAISDLIQSLEQDSANLDALNTAVEALSRLGAAAVPLLLKLIHGRPAETRIAAVLTLGQIGSLAATDPLIALLDDEDVNVRYHAIEALGAIGSRQAVPRLAETVRQGDFFLLFPAIAALGAIGDPAALPELLACLENAMVAEEALEAIGACGHPVALPTLALLLGQASVPWCKVSEACERVLQRCELWPGGAKRWQDDVIRRLDDQAVQTLLGGEVFGLTSLAAVGACRLLVGLANSRQWEGNELETCLRRSLSLSAYAGSEAPAFPLDRLQPAHLQTVVRRASRAEKLALVQILGKCPSELASRQLMQLMHEPDDLTRQAAAEAFGEASTSVSWEDLLSFAASPDDAVVAAIHEACARLRLSDDEPWDDLLSHPDPIRRGLAARAVRRVATFPAQRLLDLLDEETDADVRAALLESALVRREPAYDDWLQQRWDSLSGPETALVVRNLDQVSASEPWLTRALRSADVWTRLQAARWLSETGPDFAISPQLRDHMAKDFLPPVRAASLEVTPPSDELEKRLREALSDSEQEISRSAWRRLGRLQSSSAAQLLQEHYLATSDATAKLGLLEILEQGAGAAAGQLATSLANGSEASASTARLLWFCSSFVEPRPLISSALRHRCPEWLRPPAGTPAEAVEAARRALRSTAWPDDAVGQSVWLASACNLDDERALLMPQNISPWAERSRLLGLLQVGSPALCSHCESLSGEAKDQGLADLSHRILADHCANTA